MRGVHEFNTCSCRPSVYTRIECEMYFSRHQPSEDIKRPNIACSRRQHPASPFTELHNRVIMYTTLIYICIAALTATPTVIAVGESCAVGTCMTPDNCRNVPPVGAVSTDLCPGGDNNKCCDYYAPYRCGTKGKGTIYAVRFVTRIELKTSVGTCKYTNQGCSGTWQTGFCPYGSDFKCCLPN